MGYMTESNSKSSFSSNQTSIFSSIQNYVSSKRIIYLISAIVLSVAIYLYMNKNKKEVVVQQVEQGKQQEILFSQELVQNLYRNNTNPVQYLLMLQQQGQIPNGPLPRIILDYNINDVQRQQQQIQQPQQQQQLQPQQIQQMQPQQIQQLQQNQLPKIEETNRGSEFIEEINYENNVKTANSMNSNQYQKIEDDEFEDDLVNQKLTQAEIEKINNKIINK